LESEVCSAGQSVGKHSGGWTVQVIWFGATVGLRKVKGLENEECLENRKNKENKKIRKYWENKD
jgi:hypothetical protein